MMKIPFILTALTFTTVFTAQPALAHHGDHLPHQLPCSAEQYPPVRCRNTVPDNQNIHPNCRQYTTCLPQWHNTKQHVNDDKYYRHHSRMMNYHNAELSDIHDQYHADYHDDSINPTDSSAKSG
ncbi:hypothetical protein [Plesiomonas shigelloides]|uniref:hypothetical protein n=1 Tax=Plesiomonas shigelloides TaxID=703 RepID=UPI001261F068|nr:hypothetical protein [Plesiomonas shigelloides]KAB7695051.1 hypothetical protein GBN15_13515 [Plesiomonas shigelloides]